jgi:hypothetical protein
MVSLQIENNMGTIQISPRLDVRVNAANAAGDGTHLRRACADDVTQATLSAKSHGYSQNCECTEFCSQQQVDCQCVQGGLVLAVLLHLFSIQHRLAGTMLQ